MKRTLNDVKFVLKDPSSEFPTLIYLIYRFNGQRLKYSTGEKVIGKDWDSVDQRIATNQKDRELRQRFRDANSQLDRYSSKVLELRRSFDLSGSDLSVEVFKFHLDREFKKSLHVESKSPPNESLFEFAQRFIEECKRGERLVRRQNKKYSLVTLKTHQTTLTNLKEFQGSIEKSIDFQDIDLNFHRQFIRWLTTSKKYASNSIGNQIKHLKAWLRAASVEGLHNNRSYESDEFNKPKEDTIAIYLTDYELTKIYNLDLSLDKRLDKVRDLFLIGAYTGLRFSDFSQLRKENLTNDGQILKIRTQKTQSQVHIPINSLVSTILEKHFLSLPRPISNQKMNEYLKEIGKKANLTEKVEVSLTKGGQRVSRFVEKYSIISTHTARRSFATNAYLAGVGTLDIMRITGHQTETSFMKYIKITGEETALRMLQHEHFK